MVSVADRGAGDTAEQKSDLADLFKKFNNLLCDQEKVKIHPKNIIWVSRGTKTHRNL